MVISLLFTNYSPSRPVECLQAEHAMHTPARPLSPPLWSGRRWLVGWLVSAANNESWGQVEAKVHVEVWGFLRFVGRAVRVLCRVLLYLLNYHGTSRWVSVRELEG